MADVTEVIHKISYEVNDEALINATKAIQAQIVELGRLHKALDGYASQLESLSKSSIKQFDTLVSKIEETNKKININVSATKGALEEVFKGVLKSFDIPTSLKDSVALYLKDIRKEFNALSLASRKTSTSFSSVLKTSMANLSKSLLSINGLLGIGANLLIDFATEMYNAGKKTDVVGDQLNSLHKDLEQIEKDVYTNASNNISRIQYLASIVDDTTRSMDDRLDALKKLQEEFPGYFNNLDEEAVKHGKVAKAVEGATNAILAQASAQAAYEQFRKVSSDEFNAGRSIVQIQKQIDDLTKNANPQYVNDFITHYKSVPDDPDDADDPNSRANNMIRSIRLNNPPDGSTGVDTRDLNPLLDKLAETKQLQKKLQDEKISLLKQAKALTQSAQFILASTNGNKNDTKDDEETKDDIILPDNNRLPPKPKPKPVKITLEIKHDEEQLTQDVDSYVDSIVQPLKAKLEDKLADIATQELAALQDIEDRYARGSLVFEDYEAEKTRVSREYAIKRLEAEISNIDAILTNYEEGSDEYVKLVKERQIKVLEASKLKNEGKTAADVTKATKTAAEEEEKKKQADKHKAEIQEKIDSYQELAKAVVEAYNTILQTQIDALDKEISIREKRVEAAKALAEKGNVAVLKMEEDRLQKAQKKRAEYAKKQQIVNAAITVSNAVAAVARAALEGGGFGSIATIAALLAALAAGYASVTSLSQDNAFADGVVGFNGRGGPRDDKNWVRISNGESVITAEGTRHNQALLEAINSGSRFNVLGMPDMPLLKQPTGIYQQYAYATTKDLNGLEQKFDEVVGAIEKNKMKQNIFFNEYGVGIMTEKAISKTRKRWK